jgi:2-dehydropantoate 2-reductase
LADAPRIAVLGAGSVGCFIGAAWQARGLPVTFIGRRKLAEDLAANGLTVSDYRGWTARFEPSQVDYRTDSSRLAEASVIALCVKSGATADAAREIVDNGREGSLVISFQNGISNVDVLGEMLGDRFRVVRGMVPYNVAFLGAGRFHKGVAGDLVAQICPETLDLSERVGEGPARLRLADDMLAIAWGKLLINLNNAVNALSGKPLVEQLRERDYRRVVAASQREGIGLLKRSGIRPAKVGAVGPGLLPSLIGSPDWLFNSVFLKAWKIDDRARSSMADDIVAGRKTEIDHINGELVRIADRLGVDAPVNRAVVRLVHEAEAGHGPWQAGDLRREVLG